MIDFETQEIALRIRIKSLPLPGEFDEFDLSRFEVGQVYSVTPQLASLLIIGGYAEIVARRGDRAEAADWPRR